MPSRRRNAVPFTTPLCALLALAGCASSPSGGSRVIPDQPRGPARAAIVEGRSITPEALFERLAEAAGAEILAELALEQQLDRALRREGLEIGSAEIAAERQRVLDAIAAAEPGADPGALATSVRAQRGLGPVRFERAVWRNAALRSLAADRGIAEPTDADIDRVIAARHGPARRVRLTVLPTEREAAATRAEIGSADPSIRAILLAARSAEASLDTSASRGGLYQRLGLEDQRLPQAVRSAAARTEPGELAPVIALDGGFAVMLVEAVIPPDEIERDTIVESVRAELADAAEQRAMDRLAAGLLEGAEVLITDPSLRWSWDATR